MKWILAALMVMTGCVTTNSYSDLTQPLEPLYVNDTPKVNPEIIWEWNDASWQVQEEVINHDGLFVEAHVGWPLLNTEVPP